MTVPPAEQAADRDAAPRSTVRPAPGTSSGARLTLLGGALLVMGAAQLAAVSGPGWFGPVEPGTVAVLLLLFLLFVTAESSQIHVEVRHQTFSLSFSELPLVLGLFLVPPHWLLAARLVAAVVVFALRRTAAMKVAFNLGLFTAEVGTAAVLFQVLGAGDGLLARDWLIAYLTMLVVGLLGACAVTLAIILIQGTPAATDLLWTLAPMLLTVVTNTTIALIVVVVLTVERAGWLLLVLLVAMAVAYRVYDRLVRQHADLGRLFTFTQNLGSAGGSEATVAALLQEARELLRAESAALVTSAPDRLGVAPVPAVLPSSTRDPGLRGRLLELGWRDAVMVPVAFGPGPPAVLQVGNSLGAMRTFGSSDLRLLRTLAAHAEVSYRNGHLLEQARYDAEHDDLTGLTNRSLFMQRLQGTLDRFPLGGPEDGAGSSSARPGGAAVLLLDLDRFKDINDSLGHHIGDDLLEQVAHRLQDKFDDSALVSRLGGDEFAVLLDPCASSQTACDVADETRAALSGPFDVAGTSLEVGVSIGVVLLPADGREAATVLQHADIAMYEAKHAARGVVRYVPADEHASRRRLELAGELRRAIETRQITVRYQPQMSLANGAITSFEALARWEHPVRGLLTPDEFIPIAEQTGLITTLTHDILRQAMQRCRSWQRTHPGVGVSVNLSTRDLRDRHMPDVVAALLAETGLDAPLLTLEITECSVIGDIATASAVLQSLRELGAHLSLDDFGIGYSSLTYLQRLPVDEVKIDKSFVAPMMSSSSAAAITRAVIGLGHSLNLTVVAEGVEDEASREALRLMGCDIVQGYLLSRPLESCRLDEWLAALPDQPVISPRLRRGLRAI